MSMFKSTNPALRSDAFAGWRNNGGMSLEEAKIGIATINGTINATLILTGVCAASAVTVASFVNPKYSFAAVGSGLVCLITLIMAFSIYAKPMWARVLAFPYALVKGATLGVFSIWATEAMKGTAIGGATGQGVIYLAMGGTMAVLLCMLALYKSRVIRGSTMLKRVMCVSGAAIGLMCLGSFVAGFFGADTSAIWGNGPLAIGITIAFIVYGAFSLTLDFDEIEQYVEIGSPKAMEWYGGYILLASLAWLYIHFLRLIVQLAGRRD